MLTVKSRVLKFTCLGLFCYTHHRAANAQIPLCMLTYEQLRDGIMHGAVAQTDRAAVS
jgi:hypothetical protein